MKTSSLLNKAIRAAKKTPNGKATPSKCRAVHAWHKAVKEMLSA